MYFLLGMKNSVLTQMGALLGLIVAAFFLVDPMHMQMPENMHMATLAGVVICAGIFAVFVLSEGRGDERDDANRAFAGRVAFFIGAVVPIVAILVQTLSHALDPWLVYALVGMVAGKVGARLFADTSK